VQKLALVMVGLPARGKTYTARKLARYLSWLGHATRVFNVGSYRRARLGARQPHAFFDPTNPEGAEARRALALAALDDMLGWLRGGGEVAIYDATNSTRERRALLAERCRGTGVDVVFVESSCDDPAIIDANVRETKARSPDYEGVSEDDAVRDFLARIAHYQRSYEPVSEQEGAYVRVVDVGRKLEVHRIRGDLSSRVVYFLLNLHIQPRSVWITRHGESESNVEGRIGGDSGLSLRGQAYAGELAEYVRTHVAPPGAPLVVWTSTLRRTLETAAGLERPTVRWRALDEIDAGLCDGMTYDEIAERMPDEYAARQRDKFRYRYPRGESYQDVIARLEPVILALERERQPLLVVAHQAVLRALYAYLMDRPAEECPRIDMPLHTLIQLTPTAYGCDERRFPLEPAPLDQEGYRSA
jgi:broad specificity phosphatase PhoE/predicted kinase